MIHRDWLIRYGTHFVYGPVWPDRNIQPMFHISMQAKLTHRTIMLKTKSIPWDAHDNRHAIQVVLGHTRRWPDNKILKTRLFWIFPSSKTINSIIVDDGWWMLNYGCWIMDAELCMLNYGCWIMDDELWMLNYGCWIMIRSLKSVSGKRLWKSLENKNKIP